MGKVPSPPSLTVLAGRVLWSAGSDFALAGAFLVTWISPYALGERSVHRFTFMMLIEFLVVHSTGFLGAIGDRQAPLRARALQYTGLMALYILFASAFSVTYGSAWPLLAFLMSFLSKLPNTVLRPPSEDGQFTVMSQWAAMTVLYLGGVFLTVIAPVPALGITPEVIASQNFGVGGIWPEEPYRVMAFGVVYFGGLGLLSVFTEVVGFARGVKRARQP